MIAQAGTQDQSHCSRAQDGSHHMPLIGVGWGLVFRVLVLSLIPAWVAVVPKDPQLYRCNLRNLLLDLGGLCCQAQAMHPCSVQRRVR